MRKVLFVVLGFFALCLFVVIGSEESHKISNASAAISAAPAIPARSESAPATPPAPESMWSYGQDTDNLTDAKSVRACISSVNELSFGFPYNGGSTATICFYKDKGKSTLINLRISKGQFLCHSYEGEGCTIAVRVGDGPVQRFSAGEPDDGSDDVLVLRSDRLLRTMTSGDRVRIEAQFYQEGKQTMEFAPKGFDARKYVLR